jgi:P27 family predicted phage terminase small subunit
MGKRGTKPTPTAILRLRGSRIPERRADEVIATGRPVRPEHLTGEAAAMFDRLVLELDELKIIGAIDGWALTRYVELWELYRKAADYVAKNGTSIQLKNKAGQVYVKRRPELSAMLSLSQALSQLENSFGLNPSARTSLHIQKPLPVNPLGNLMNRQSKNIKLLTESNNGG